MPLLASRFLPLGAKSRLYFACVHRIMLYGSWTWPVNHQDVVRIEIDDARMVRWMCNVRPEVRISVEELRARLKCEEPEGVL